jgi:predicted N-formylglutamate amidohydrolase
MKRFAAGLHDRPEVSFMHLLNRPLYETTQGKAGLLLISIHEGEHVPTVLEDASGRPLGLEHSALKSHIAVDLGIGEVTRELQALTGAYVFKATHSRLVADLNRFPDEDECIAPTADGIDIPVNRALSGRERRDRLQQYFYPVLHALSAYVEDVAIGCGAEPLVICMHSFARTLSSGRNCRRNEDICVFSYPEFYPIQNLEMFVNALREQNPELRIGLDEPFSARTPGLKTEPGDKRLASPPSYYGVVKRNNIANHFAIEVCQDLIADRRGQSKLASAIAMALEAVPSASMGCNLAG